MSDLIDRQAAIDALDGVKVDEENCTEYDIGYNDGIDFAVSSLSVLPSAQPEIIRCKDCKKWLTNYLPVCGKHGCDVMLDYTKPDDFCSWAERRTDEKENV